MRQALASMLWSKQHYFFDLDRWLEEHHVHPLRDEGGDVRNRGWFHMVNDDVISMPDTWEYPWYASWDLAFHTVALAMVDLDFAKDQLELMLHELYLHPNGQLPAYEWNFSDVNPPVHAWATLLVYESEVEQRGAGDVDLVEAGVPEAARQLHVVGQPQGPDRAQRVRGRVPRSRQHRRVRSQLAAARRVAGSSSRTARRGWRSSPRRCSASPSSCPSTTRCTRTWC